MDNEKMSIATSNVFEEWKIYTALLPDNATYLGVVTLCNHTGALVRLKNGKYVMINDGAYRTLDGRKVAGILGNGGRPRSGNDKKISVCLNDESINFAKAIGNGNLSEGIRSALSIISAQNT